MHSPPPRLLADGRTCTDASSQLCRGSSPLPPLPPHDEQLCCQAAQCHPFSFNWQCKTVQLESPRWACRRCRRRCRFGSNGRQAELPDNPCRCPYLREHCRWAANATLARPSGGPRSSAHCGTPRWCDTAERIAYQLLRGPARPQRRTGAAPRCAADGGSRPVCGPAQMSSCFRVGVGVAVCSMD